MVAITTNRTTTTTNPPPPTTQKKKEEEKTTTTTGDQTQPPGSSTTTTNQNNLDTSKTLSTNKTSTSDQPTTNPPPESSTTTTQNGVEGTSKVGTWRPKHPELKDSRGRLYETLTKREQIDVVATEMQKCVQLLNQQSSTNKAFAAMLGAQDFPHVAPGTNEDAFIAQIQTFLKDVQADGNAAQTLNRTTATYTSQINTLVNRINLMKSLGHQGGVTSQELSTWRPGTTANFKAALGDYAASSTAVLDMNIQYQTRLGDTAKAFNDAWNQTGVNQKTLAKQKVILTALLTIGGVGIGANAVMQLASKEIAAFATTAGATFSQLSNIVLLRGGQIVNMVGAGLAAGYLMKSGSVGSTQDAIDQSNWVSKFATLTVQGLANRVDAHIKNKEMEAKKWNCYAKCESHSDEPWVWRDNGCDQPNGPCAGL